MNENIDLTKILDGCPKYTPFYSQIFGTILFIRIETCLSGKYIVFALCNHGVFSVDSKGKYAISNGSTELDCIVFPSKDQRDWSKFERFWDKPKVEKFDVNTLQPFDKVLVRYAKGRIWLPDLFGYKDDMGTICVANGCTKRECIPYNEETKRLVGTSDDCPDYYRWWEE